jgi:hypothetical protein
MSQSNRLPLAAWIQVLGNLRKMADFPVVSPPQSSGFSDSIPAAIKTMHHVFS